MPTLSPQVTPYYGGGQVEQPADTIQTSGAPSTANINHNIGTIAIDNAAANAYMLMSKVGNSATWNLIGGSSSGFTGIAGNSGVATPSAGVLTISGAANELAFSAASHTVSVGLSSTLVTPGTITSTGDVTVDSGNLIINSAAQQLQIHGGADTDFIGEATLVAGTVTVANTNIASTDRIFIQRRSANGSTAIGALEYSISAATSFTINAVQMASPSSLETNDVSIVDYVIVRQL